MSVKSVILAAVLCAASLHAQTLVQSVGSTNGGTPTTSLSLGITATTSHSIILGVSFVHPRAANNQNIIACGDGVNTYTLSPFGGLSGSIFGINGGVLAQYSAFAITGGNLTITCNFTAFSGGAPIVQYASMQAMEFTGINGFDSGSHQTAGGSTGLAGPAVDIDATFTTGAFFSHDIVVGFASVDYATGAETIVCPSPGSYAACSNIFFTIAGKHYYFGAAIPASGSNLSAPAVIVGQYCIANDTVENYTGSGWQVGTPYAGANGTYHGYQCNSCTVSTLPSCFVTPSLALPYQPGPFIF